MTNWPVIIKYKESDELSFVKDESHWLKDIKEHIHDHQNYELVIDSCGATYSLQLINLGSLGFIKSDITYSLSQLINLVKGYAVFANYCCASKIVLKNKTQVLELVQYIYDNE